jgi:hypothetical protein
MNTKTLTPEVLEHFAAKARNPNTAAMIRSGVLERITDLDGTTYARADIIRRDLGGENILLTKTAPLGTPHTPSTVAVHAAKIERKPADTSDLAAEMKRYLTMTPEQEADEAFDAAVEKSLAPTRQTPPAPKVKPPVDDLSDLLAEINGGEQ